MFLTPAQYLTFLKDPTYYKQVSDLLQEAFAYRGVQYFVHAGGFFVALRTTGKEVIACARISRMFGSTGSYLIRNIVVGIGHRGKGLCPKLLEEALRELKKKGATRLYLDVDPENAPAVRCYTGVGFVPAGTRTYNEKKYTRMVKEF